MVPGEKIALENLDQLINQHMAFLIRTVAILRENMFRLKMMTNSA